MRSTLKRCQDTSGYILPGTKVSGPTEVVEVSSDFIEYEETVENVMKFYLPIEDIENWKIEFYNSFEFYGQERVEIEKKYPFNLA